MKKYVQNFETNITVLGDKVEEVLSIKSKKNEQFDFTNPSTIFIELEVKGEGVTSRRSTALTYDELVSRLFGDKRK